MRQTSSTRTRRHAIPVDRLLPAAVVALFVIGEFPPSGNVGASENGAEATSFDSRFETEPSKTTRPADTATTGIATNEVAGDAVRQLDREEIAVFRRRGEEFVLVGDITCRTTAIAASGRGA